ncbi:MAG: hypothetical protein LBR06_02220 [Bacteroidales bacterium]|nr:hypothetical protein [Bacteroidales bacterium]
MKYQFHFERKTYCDDEDKRLSSNPLSAIKKLNPSQGLIDFFINERQNEYLFDDKSGTLRSGLNSNWNSTNELHIAVYKKKCGIGLGGSKFTIMLPL